MVCLEELITTLGNIDRAFIHAEGRVPVLPGQFIDAFVRPRNQKREGHCGVL